MRNIVFFFVLNFLLHLFWENLQMPFYVGYDQPFQHFTRCFQATATGDMLFTLVIYASLAVVHRDPHWLSKKESYDYPATWILAIVLGILLAVGFEFWAVNVAHRFAYDTMPMIPVVRVGLTPVLQMIVIPVLSLIISRKFAQ